MKSSNSKCLSSEWCGLTSQKQKNTHIETVKQKSQPLDTHIETSKQMSQPQDKSQVKFTYSVAIYQHKQTVKRETQSFVSQWGENGQLPV